MPEKKKLNSKRGLDSLHQGKKREKNSFCSPPEKKLAYHLVGVSKVTLGASLLSVGKLAAISPSRRVEQWRAYVEELQKKKKMESGIWGFAEGRGRGTLACVLEEVGVGSDGCIEGMLV